MKLFERLKYRAQIIRLTQHTARLEAEIDSLKASLVEYRHAINTLIDTTSYIMGRGAQDEQGN